MAMTSEPLRALSRPYLLFDVDGVLIDSGPAHTRVWEGWARHHGLDRDTVIRATQGRRRLDTLRLMAPERPVAEENRLLDELMAVEEPGIQACQGAAVVLRSLEPGSWAVVTSSRRRSTLTRMTALGLPVPDVRICAEDVVEGKPSPEGYLAAAAALSADPRDCVVIEDSPAGIAAGRAAGCTVYAVATTHLPEQLGKADACFATLPEAVRGFPRRPSAG